MAKFELADLKATRALGKWLAANLPASNIKSIFLKGNLGCGKTTLVRFIVEDLPGAEESEITSPSFTIYNRYPTLPPVVHCDLYRVQTHIPEEILDLLDTPGILLIAEWSEFFPYNYKPEEYLEIVFAVEQSRRAVNIFGHGRHAKNLVNKLEYEFCPAQNEIAGCHGGFTS